MSWIPRFASGRGRRRRIPINRDLRRWLLSCELNLGEVLFAVAYNEFCAPTLEESVEELIKKGATHITVTTTMFTPGGSHSEVEIPEILEQLRKQYPDIVLRYAWPFDMKLIAAMLATQVKQF